MITENLPLQIVEKKFLNNGWTHMQYSVECYITDDDEVDRSRDNDTFLLSKGCFLFTAIIITNIWLMRFTQR